MFRGSVKGTGYPLHSPVSPLLPLPCVIVCHHISTAIFHTSRVDGPHIKSEFPRKEAGKNSPEPRHPVTLNSTCIIPQGQFRTARYKHTMAPFTKTDRLIQCSEIISLVCVITRITKIHRLANCGVWGYATGGTQSPPDLNTIRDEDLRENGGAGAYSRGQT